MLEFTLIEGKVCIIGESFIKTWSHTSNYSGQIKNVWGEWPSFGTASHYGTIKARHGFDNNISFNHYITGCSFY